MKSGAKNTAESGSIMMITVIAACLLGLTLGSYLLLVRAESVSVARSQAWNAALTVASAGVEEALAALNQNAAGQTNGWGPPDLSTCGWASTVNGFGPVSRTLSSGGITNGYYAVFIYINNGSPIIYSTGYVTVPAISAKISRVVQVTTTNAALSNVALAAQKGISLAYSGVFSDSFDSSTGPYQANNSGARGALSCMSGTVNVANRIIKGDILLGPGATLDGNTFSISGKIRQDLNVDSPDAVAPVMPMPFRLPAGNTNSANGVWYNYAFSNTADYVTANLNGSVYVAQQAVVNLLVTDAATLEGLYIAGSNSTAGKLTIYMSGANFTFGITNDSGLLVGGTNIVENQNSTSFSYFGLPGNHSVNFNLSRNGTPNFYGTIYAPSADLFINDDYYPGASYAYFGAVTAKSITQVGKVTFHFDENLARSGPRRGYIVTSWQEM
jgi:hypothetical protein